MNIRLNSLEVNGHGMFAHMFWGQGLMREPHPSLNVPSTERAGVISGKVKKGCKASLRLLSRLPARHAPRW